jgi:hypothetical protein
MSGKSQSAAEVEAAELAPAPEPMPDFLPRSNSAAIEEMPRAESPSPAPFLRAVTNQERVWTAENSVDGYNELNDKPDRSRKEDKKLRKLNKQVRSAVGAEVDDMVAEGDIGPGEVQDTYQSGHDTGADFGAARSVDGFLDDTYVLHGHFEPDGKTKPGSMGLKRSDDEMGMRIGHGLPDALGGDPGELEAASICGTVLPGFAMDDEDD